MGHGNGDRRVAAACSGKRCGVVEVVKRPFHGVGDSWDKTNRDERTYLDAGDGSRFGEKFEMRTRGCIDVFGEFGVVVVR